MGRAARDDARGVRRRSASRSRSSSRSKKRGGSRRDGERESRRRASASRSRSAPRPRESERSRRHRSRPREQRRRHRDDRSRSRSRESRKRRRRADSRADEKRSRFRAREEMKSSRRGSSADKKEEPMQTVDKKEVAVSDKDKAVNGAREPQKEATSPTSADAENQEQKDAGSPADDAPTSEADGDVVMEEASESLPVKEDASNVTPSSQEQPNPSTASASTTAVVSSTASASSTAASSAPATPPTSAVDVKSIKMDILKALAEARSTIAGIKGVTGTQNADSTKDEKPMVQPLNGVALPSEQQKPQSPKKKQDQDHPAAPPSSEKKPEESAPLPKKATASAAEEFDMFAMVDLDEEEVVAPQSDPVVPTINVAGLQLNCDDAEGYYNTTVGEVLNGKYRVLGSVGKGVFSTVLRCQCVPPLSSASGAINVVAIKLIRNNDVMREAAQTEVRLLNELAAKDPRDKKHCVRLLDTFSHRSHVALVFEPMQMNLREAMKKFGGKSGISIQAVRVFSKHLLIALNHLDTCDIIHADIKPDNILLDEKQTTIKLCDFGSAFKVTDGKQDPTPYLVSRFYRAPEIVLGLAYDKAVDMWSVGCCLFEMFTGKVMFPGSTNNEMLKLFMELKGKVPNKLIKKHRQAYIDQFQIEPHFTEDMKFCSRESDRVTGKPLLRLMETIKPKNDLAGALMSAKSATDDRKQVLELKRLLDRMFTLDPAKRISVREALAHPFIKG